MDQQDIFRLILIVLLIANRQLSNQGDETDDEFSYTLINDLLLLTLASKGFDSDNDDGTTF